MRVLIAIDGSPPSLAAVDEAGRLLTPERDAISLYYSPPGVELIRSSAGATVHRGRQAMARKVFEQALSRLPTGWAPLIRTVIGVGDPREEVLQTAQELKSELIVVGGRHYNALERLMLSSVSRTVAHAAQVPVLIVPTPETPRSAAAEYRILVAFENEASGKRMASTLNRFCWPAHCSVACVQAVPNIFGGKIPDWLDAQSRSPDAEALVKLWVDEHDGQLAAAGERVRGVCREFPEPLRQVSVRVCEGQPAQEILQVAHEQHSDLLVIGAKDSTPLGRLLLGSTAEYLLNHARCPVLLIHHSP